MGTMQHNEETKNVEFEILEEIKKAEAKSAYLVESALKEKGAIIAEAQKGAARLLQESQDRIFKEQESRISEFREKSRLIREEKLGEAKIQVRQIKSKSDKSMQKAVDFVLQKIEASIP